MTWSCDQTSSFTNHSLRPGDLIFSATGIRFVVAVEDNDVHVSVTFLHFNVGIVIIIFDKENYLDSYFWRGYTLIRTGDV